MVLKNCKFIYYIVYLTNRISMKNNYKEFSINENENNIHKEPLKTDSTSMGGNLERSYSSPNLLQVSYFI